MRIGLTMREVSNTSYHEVRDAISQDWIEYLQGHHFSPILIPNGLTDIHSFLKEMSLSAIVLSNGNDLSLNEFASPEASPKRDKVEKAILEWSLLQGLPVLGVCRGHQFIAKEYGAKIGRFEGEGHINKTQTVRTRGKWIDQLGSALTVNSYHNFYVSLSDLPAVIEVLAEDEEGIAVEAFRIKNKKILCMQWHPERAHIHQNITDKIMVDFLKGNK